jgi:hypothetical protein
MKMETPEILVENNENDRFSWINHWRFKALIVGFVIGAGFALASVFSDNFMIQSETRIQQLILNLGVPIIGIYLVAIWVRIFLMRSGFEGFSGKLGEGITISKLAIGVVVSYLGVLFVDVIIFILNLIYERVDDEKIIA